MFLSVYCKRYCEYSKYKKNVIPVNELSTEYEPFLQAYKLTDVKVTYLQTYWRSKSDTILY